MSDDSSITKNTKGFERSEADAWIDMVRSAPAEAIEACGARSFEVGGASIAIASGVDVLAFNRVLGAGLDEPVTGEILDEIIARYDAAGVGRFFVQPAPAAAPSSLPGLLVERRFCHYNNWVKLYRGVEEPPEVQTDLRIEVIDDRHAGEFASIVTGAFEWPERIRPWLAALVGRPGWRHYLAFDGGKPAATGAMFTGDGWCWKDFAATLPDCRSRGAQQALLARSIDDAASMGCHTLVLETAEDKPDRPSPSYRNVVRFGFKTAYLRPNYLFGG